MAAITRVYETFNIEGKKHLLERRTLINDMAKTIRKIDRHEITYYNNVMRDIESKRNVLREYFYSVFVCREEALHHRQAVVECKLDEYPELKDHGFL